MGVFVVNLQKSETANELTPGALSSAELAFSAASFEDPRLRKPFTIIVLPSNVIWAQRFLALSGTGVPSLL